MLNNSEELTLRWHRGHGQVSQLLRKLRHKLFPFAAPGIAPGGTAATCLLMASGGACSGSASAFFSDDEGDKSELSVDATGGIGAAGPPGPPGPSGPSSSSGPGVGNLAPTANAAGGGQGPRDPKLCGVLACLANKAGKSSYCGGHRRVVEGMEAQVSTHGEEAIWEKCSKDPAALTEEVNRRVEHNPCLMKPYARHPPMEWSQVQRRFSNRAFMRDESVLKKLDKIEYRHRMKNKRGWELSRSDAEFARLEANPDIGRDFLGEGGSVRLFLSKGDYIVAGSELNDEASYIAQSKAVKHAKPEVAAAMRQSIGHDHKYLTDGFFDPIGGRSFSNSSANQVASTFTQPAPQAETPPAKLGRKGRHATGSSVATSALDTGDEQEVGADDTKKDRDVGSDRNRAVGSARKDQKFMIEALTTNLAGAAAALQNPELDAQDELYTNELKVRMELGDLLLNQKWDGTKAYEDQDALEKAIEENLASFSIPPVQGPANLISLRAVENKIKNITSANCEDSSKKAVAEFDGVRKCHANYRKCLGQGIKDVSKSLADKARAASKRAKQADGGGPRQALRRRALRPLEQAQRRPSWSPRSSSSRRSSSPRPWSTPTITTSRRRQPQVMWTSGNHGLSRSAQRRLPT